MLSKGVDYFFFVSGASSSMNASAYDNGASSPKWQQAFTSSPEFQIGNVQIDFRLSTDLHGSFTWTVNTASPLTRSASINPVTGNLGSCTLANMMDTPSVMTANHAVSYGFYDAGPGIGDLTNQDQAYVYVTPPMAGWMGRLAAQYPQVNNQPFCQFALPGSHDAGTFDLTKVKSLLGNAQAVGSFVGLLNSGLFFGGVLTLAASQALTAITNLAVTQKDTITNQLDLGCRYFDFRPGYSPTAIREFAPDIYHQHTVIPGYPFSSFMADVVSWLDAHPGEIVVVAANHQGFAQNEMIPSGQTLQAIVTKALQPSVSKLATGTAADLSSTYGELISANKRLIFLNDFAGWCPSKKYDSYSDKAYATTDPAPIIKALAAMNTTGQAGNDYTVLQLQGTATNTGKAVIIAAATSQSGTASPLMSTKPDFDSNTYPWLTNNVGTNLSSNQLVVFLNDFVDNALAERAAAITAQRMGLPQSMTVHIESNAFPGVFLRMDGSQVNQFNPQGSGTVNCQYTPPGPWEAFKITTLADGTSNIESVTFPGVFLRMDGSQVNQFNPQGSGTVNCQYTPPGPWEAFKITTLADGTSNIESNAFPGVFLRMDGSQVNQFNPQGSGTVNCQYTPPGPWEAFKITPVS